MNFTIAPNKTIMHKINLNADCATHEFIHGSAEIIYAMVSTMVHALEP